MKITGYWASDIIHKKVFPTVTALLKEECPTLYERYTKLLKDNSKNFYQKIISFKKFKILTTKIFSIYNEITLIGQIINNYNG